MNKLRSFLSRHATGALWLAAFCYAALFQAIGTIPTVPLMEQLGSGWPELAWLLLPYLVWGVVWRRSLVDWRWLAFIGMVLTLQPGAVAAGVFIGSGLMWTSLLHRFRLATKGAKP